VTELEHTEHVKQTWERVSPAWERHRDHVFAQTLPVSEWLVDHVEPRTGDTLLELGAGPGETGFLAAQRLGSGGRLVSTDISAGMVEAARRGAADRGLTNIEHLVMDAQRLDLPDDSVDGVLSRFALMLVPEPARAMAEARRVLRPGGRIAYAVWGAMDRNPWVTVVIAAVLQHGHTPGGGADAGPFGPGGLFSLAAAEANTAPMTAAGFADVDVEEVTGAMRFGTFDEYWEVQTSLAGPIVDLFATLTADEVAAVRATAESGAEPYRGASGYALPYTATAVSARAPAA
jgi:ubiquinone/menaquinone biosynthesis C-methylase UbiE